MHLYHTETHGEHSVSCNGSRGECREKPESSLILASQYPFVKVERNDLTGEHFISLGVHKGVFHFNGSLLASRIMEVFWIGSIP
jgi:hypothetical protein